MPVSVSTGMAATQHQKTILLLSLNKLSFFDEQYAKLTDLLASNAAIKSASSPSAALDFLSSNTPHAIIVTDEAIVEPENSSVLDKLISYACAGGIVVVGCHFSSFISPDEFESFFARWALPWKLGNYSRETVSVNHQVRGVDKVGLPAAYSQKAVFINNISPDAALYQVLPDPEDESFPSRYHGQTPVAYTKIGDGWLGYVGDVNAEAGSDLVIWKMCRL
ncbi:hypothetical protein FQN52_001179 [Onygenales sp. PD_12]|nr:hypothetical protein FQN53_006584 [Emmonsiellopsis sp. PD_33]KAK2793592.1 hypothetical protein FQN52_001179 [Onygenales sp. PD_12]